MVPRHLSVESGIITEIEKAQVADKYHAVGWEHVVITESSENGERGGLMQVKLFVS